MNCTSNCKTTLNKLIEPSFNITSDISINFSDITIGGLQFYKRISNPILNQGNAEKNKGVESYPTDTNNTSLQRRQGGG